MPWSALPDHLNPRITPDAWKNTDNDTWFARWTFALLGLQAFGPRAKEWWAAWKFPPKMLFKIGGKGTWREEIIDSEILTSPGDPLSYYRVLSREQYFKRWAFIIEWPLSFRFHVYWKAKDVPVAGQPWVNDFDITRLFFVYGPIHWDADLVYWVLSFYFGGQWK